VHVIPRYVGDGLTIPATPVQAEPSEVAAAADALRAGATDPTDAG
jgi:hypothetical protein